MPSWDTTQYLKFASERTQPSIDLAARIALASPRRVIDLGCGPGNSTDILARRWPGAVLAGLDSSAAMIAAAAKDYPQRTWLTGDIATWTAPGEYDVVFSNAALQWVPDHPRVLPHLFAQVAPGGVFAFQVPANFDAPPHRLMRELGASPAWQRYFDPPPREWHAHPAEFYYDTLAPLATHLDLWTTDYFHLLDGVDGIVAWYRGTGLRPWLDVLPDDATRTRFLADYRTALAPHFPPRPDGRVLFPFRRLFVVAYR